MLSDHVFVGKPDSDSGYRSREISIVLSHVDVFMVPDRSVSFGSGSVTLTPESFAEFLVAIEKYLGFADYRR